MMPMASSVATAMIAQTQSRATGLLRTLLVGLTAFLTVVDLFATQAILPALTRAYGTTPAAMSFAVNASTIGMAISGLAVALFGRRIDRRLGIMLSLAALTVPTLLLAKHAEPWGVRLSARRAGTVHGGSVHADARLSRGDQHAAGGGLGVRRLYHRQCREQPVRASVVRRGGRSFWPGLELLCVRRAESVRRAAGRCDHTAAARASGRCTHDQCGECLVGNLRDPALRAAFAIGFCILFAFIGTFTYVNFVLVRQPFALGMMGLGFVYFVFLPSVVSTPFAGRVALRCGTRATCAGALAFAAAGLPLMLLPSLQAVLAGMVLLSVGTFFAQAVATGFVGRAARADRASASGTYLACYFLGGLVGSLVLGQIYDRLGWPACVGGIALSLTIAIALCVHLRIPHATCRP